MGPGEVWLARVPFTDLTSEKVRPVLIVSAAQSAGMDFVVVAISSVLRSNQPFDIVVQNTESDFSRTGLKVSSAIKTNKMVTISRSIFQKKLGSISEDRIFEVKNRLKLLFDI